MNPYQQKPETKGSKRKRKPKTHITVDHPQHGKIEIRHMRAVLHGEPCLLTAADNDVSAPVWIQLAKQGSFNGHSAGPFEMNTKTFQEIVRNFKAHPEHIPIDFEHASESDASSGSIPHTGAPAQGWIVDMKIENGNLYGLVEWGALAREYIKNGQYKYFSPAIRFGAKDRVTGKPIGARMTSGALTNSPFLSGMQLVAAKDLDDLEEEDDGDIIQDEGSSNDDEEASASAEEDNPTEGEEPMDPKQLKDAEDKIAIMSDRLAMADTKLKEAEKLVAAKDAELTMVKAEHTALLAWKTEREEADNKAEVEAAFETYRDARKLTEAMKPAMLVTLKAAPEAFRTMYPVVRRGQEHLLRNIASDGPATGRNAMSGGGSVSMSERTRQLMDEKKLSFAAAQSEASKEFRNVFLNGGR